MDKLEDRIHAKKGSFSDTITQELHREEKVVGDENLEPVANKGARGRNRTADTRIFSRRFRLEILNNQSVIGTPVAI